jgi:hypothetical protein
MVLASIKIETKKSNPHSLLPFSFGSFMSLKRDHAAMPSSEEADLKLF